MISQSFFNQDLSRRCFLKRSVQVAAGAAAVMTAPSLFAASGQEATQGLQRLPQKLHFNLHHIHTGEKLNRTLCLTELDDPVFQAEMNKLLRDWRTGEPCNTDEKLLHLMGNVSHVLDAKKPMQIVCGYRSPKTNQTLRRRSCAVAKKSFHMTGQAVDFWVPGSSVHTMRQAATSFKAGGVGAYPRSGFVHMDVRGHPAYW